ncbi:ATP-dependent RNA helicase HrpA [Ferrigenium sp. UT5]|uniref:ATP-dependent RNA helicase HrpA n=1 Tax=Ferrigenium sp. UT5 TaxID=3242105 RepID=UPI00354DD99A
MKLSGLAERRLARITAAQPIEYPADLPVVARRDELAEALEKNQVVIVCGETGSGKTTQLPKICLSIGRGVKGVIGHTQPRRVAARSVAARIAQELKSELGGLVGYKVRFNDKVSPDSAIKLMTDGILLAEIHSDPLLKQYDTLIIDEAHERSLNIDFLLGYFKQLLPRRPDLKLIITSATLDAERFAKHFDTSPLSQRGRAKEGEKLEFHAALPETLLTHARLLRKNATDAEQLLWKLLRDRQLLDAKFRRQHPLGAYILDFYCHEAKLAVELDGGQHAEDKQSQHDEKRSVWLNAQGITVLRFWNHDVLKNTEGVLQKIFDWLSEAALTPTPLPKGEGLVTQRGSGSLSPGERGGVRERAVENNASQLAPVIQVSGRTYPVEIRYRPPQKDEEGEMQDVPQAICSALDELSIGGLRGDVLVFLPGEREIRETAEALRKHQHKGIEILPLFSRLSTAEQDRVFKVGHQRRVVLATNVAETSLTVPNIGYVIDTGVARVNRYSIRQKVEQLHIEKIARAAANQRAGRCGRVMSGICIRLYDEEEFAQRAEFTDPEIFRVSLATVILRMSALGLGDVAEFPFIEPPGSRAIADGYQLLTELGAISESVPPPQPSPGGRGSRALTPIGHQLAKLPLDPKIARLLLAGKQYHCLTEIVIIASALSLQDPRDRPAERREAADAAHQRFNDERSDFLAYLKLWDWFKKGVQHKKSNKLWATECRDHFLSPLRLREWHELHQQLHAQMAEMNMRLNEQPASYEQIHKALLTGLIGNIGTRAVNEPHYLGARETKFFIAPNSVLAKKGAKWVLAAELVETTRLYARCVARIEPQWLEEVGDHLMKRSYFDPHWEKKAGQVAAWERSTLFGLLINPKKRVHYGPMNPEEARAVFIRTALVEGEFNTQAPFFAHNQKLIADIEALEHKARRPDVLVDDELIFAFYDARIPPGLHNAADFEKWRKEAEREQPKLLYLKKDDLMRHEAAGITTEHFPPQLQMNNVSYALAYNFAPGKHDDGVTLTVPQALLNQVQPARCEWLVPGILAEKVAQLLKSLPQKLRRHCVPVPEFAAAFCADVKPSDVPLLQAIARYLREQKQVDVPLDAFRLEQLPPHLLMNFRVIEEHGRQLGMGRNFMQLRGEWAPTLSLTPALSRGEREQGRCAESSPSLSGRAVGVREDLQRHTTWDFGDFAATAQVPRAGQQVTVFNALHDEGDAVTLQAFDTADEAQAVHRAGLRRLFMLALKEQVKFLEKNLPDLQKMAMLFLPFGSQQDLQEQILSVTFDRCCLNDPLPDGEKTFSARCKDAKSRLNLVGQEIARLVGTVLTEHQTLQKILPAFKSNGQATQDIRQQLEGLLGKGWIARTPYERMQHLPRYLKAINVRLEKLRSNPARDATSLAQLLPLQQQWQRRLQAQQGARDKRLEDFGWMLQELRVSLFAQELKTPVIVSAKRLQKILDEMNR